MLAHPPHLPVPRAAPPLPVAYAFDLMFTSAPNKLFHDELVIQGSDGTGTFSGRYGETGVFNAPIEAARLGADGSVSFEFDAQQGVDVVRCRVVGQADLAAGNLNLADAPSIHGDFFFVDSGGPRHVGTFVATRRDGTVQ